MKHVLLTLLLFLFAACSDSEKIPTGDGDGQKPDPEQPEDGLTVYDVMPDYDASHKQSVSVGSSTSVSLKGLGVELDPIFFSQNLKSNGYPVCKASDWDEIFVPRIADMKIERMRMMYMPHWLEPVNDNDDPFTTNKQKLTYTSVEMKSLLRTLLMAKRQNVDVTLVFWGCQVSFSHSTQGVVNRYFMAKNTEGWCVAPNNNDEMVENFTTVLDYLVNERGLTCIKEITMFNEPNGMGGITLPQYVDIAKKMDANLRKIGLRDAIQLNLGDITDYPPHFGLYQQYVDQLKNVADLFNNHNYSFGYEHGNTQVVNWEKKYGGVASRVGKPHYIGELGSNQTEDSHYQRDIETYERGVLMTRSVINFLNGGASGVSYWVLYDHYINSSDAPRIMQLGLWRHKKDTYKNVPHPNPAVYSKIACDYEVRPQFYTYSLLTRFVRKGSQVYPLDLKNEFAAGMGVCTEANEWTYAFANNSDQALSVDLTNSHANGCNECQVYRYTEAELPTNNQVLDPSYNLKLSKEGYFKVHIPAHSVIFLTQIH